jgi:hypothetical protein
LAIQPSFIIIFSVILGVKSSKPCFTLGQMTCSPFFFAHTTRRPSEETAEAEGKEFQRMAPILHQYQGSEESTIALLNALGAYASRISYPPGL